MCASRFFSWFLTGIVLFVPQTAFAESGRPQTVDRILVEKSLRRLTLLAGEKRVRIYTVALGPSPIGPKTCQGDNKTPEGEYHIAGRNRYSAYHRSLRISYPEAADKKRAAAQGCAPGGDIMIHGLPNGTSWIGSGHHYVDWTAGCIAVTNQEIDEIWNLVKDGTKISIKP
jgi:murein L,D-transpeptidase YafK